MNYICSKQGKIDKLWGRFIKHLLELGGGRNQGGICPERRSDPEWEKIQACIQGKYNELGADGLGI